MGKHEDPALFEEEPVGVSPEAWAVYERNNATWAARESAQLRSSNRLAWTVASASLCVAVVSAAAAAFAYHRPVEPPHVVMIDAATGSPALVPPANAPAEGIRERHIRNMVWTYVRAREAWSWGEDKHNYQTVLLMTAGPLQKAFADWFYGSEGPRATLKENGSVDVQPVSVSLRGPAGAWTGALVRFRRETRYQRGGEAQPADFVVDLDFSWSPDAIRASDLLVNPFGFLVTRYYKTVETK